MADNTDAYIGIIAGAETAQDACDRLTAAGYQATVDDASLVIDDGQATASPYESTNKLGDRFYLWCVHGHDGNLAGCVPRGPTGSCPPRH